MVRRSQHAMPNADQFVLPGLSPEELQPPVRQPIDPTLLAMQIREVYQRAVYEAAHPIEPTTQIDPKDEARRENMINGAGFTPLVTDAALSGLFKTDTEQRQWRAGKVRQAAHKPKPVTRSQSFGDESRADIEGPVNPTPAEHAAMSVLGEGETNDGSGLAYMKRTRAERNHAADIADAIRRGLTGHNQAIFEMARMDHRARNQAPQNQAS